MLLVNKKKVSTDTCYNIDGLNIKHYVRTTNERPLRYRFPLYEMFSMVNT